MRPTPTLPLSAVIITRDAAQTLPACLASLHFCAEILVVDSGSQDETVALAKAAGCRVIETHWRGYGAQKQFAAEQASHDWVLSLDADERVTPALAESIARALQAPTHVAFRIARRNRFLGRYLAHGEGYPDWCVRLFDRRRAHWSDDAVHERVIVSGEIGTLDGDLLHDSAETLERYLEKQNRYSTLAAEAAWRQGKRSSAIRLFCSPLLRFVKFYLVRRGFLDGLPGLIHILIGCYASFAKHAKLIEREREELETRSLAKGQKDPGSLFDEAP
ncbi:MAG: glycosyltransferase family 2 protein [Rhodocyclaceae bacterium]|nr:glycosyltransferase family 2 protein [Rhodocyclaceae bacterium]